MAYAWAPPNLEREGVVAGFTLSRGAGLVPTITRGVLFAGGEMYRPEAAPVLPEAPANAQSWLFYADGAGFYWAAARDGGAAGDAFVGWVVTIDAAVVAWSGQSVVVDDRADVRTVVPLGELIEREGETGDVPGDVQPIGGAPFLLVKAEDGINANCDIEYDPPAAMGSFSGVTAHWVPDGLAKPALSIDFDYNGDSAAAAGTAERHGTFRFIAPQPADANTPGRVYLTSRTPSYKKLLVLNGTAGASPSVAVTILKSAGIGIPGPGTAVAFGTFARVWYKYVPGSAGTGWVFGWEGKVVPPPDASNFGGCEIYALWDGDTHEDGTPRYLAIDHVAADGGSWHSNEPGFPLEEGFEQGVSIVFVPKNSLGVERTGKGECFSVHLTVTSTGHTQQDAANPIFTHVGVEYKPVDGSWFFRFTGSVQHPLDTANYSGARVRVHWEGDTRYLDIWLEPVESGAGDHQYASGWFPLSENFSQGCETFVIPVNRMGQEPADLESCQHVSTPVSWADALSSGPNGGFPTSRIARNTIRDGLRIIGLDGDPNQGIGVNTGAGVIVNGLNQVAFNPGAGMEVVGAAACVKILSAKGLNVNAANQVELKATWGVTFDASGNLIINADTNDFDQVMGYLRQKRVDLGKAATFDSTMFKKNATTGFFEINQINANLIVLGQYKVGSNAGQGSMPGQMACWGPTGMVGWIGTNGVYYGGAFQQLYVGYTGDDVSTAKLIADGLGNLSIKNAAINVVSSGNGYTTNISTTTGFTVRWGTAGVGDNYLLQFGTGVMNMNAYSGASLTSNASLTTAGLSCNTYSGGVGAGGCAFYAMSNGSQLSMGDSGGNCHWIVAAGAGSRYANFYSLRVNGVEVITSGRVLQNVTVPAHSHASDAWFTGHTHAGYALTSHTDHTSLSVGGNTVVDSSGWLYLRGRLLSAVTYENLVLSGITSTKWIGAYDLAGNWMGKIPLC